MKIRKILRAHSRTTPARTSPRTSRPTLRFAGNMLPALALCAASLLISPAAHGGNWLCTVSYHGTVQAADYRIAANVRTIEQAKTFALGFAPRIAHTQRTVICI